MKSIFSKRTQEWSSEPNPLSARAAELRKQGKEILDLTVSNPTACGFSYLSPDLLKNFNDLKNLKYEPDPRGLLEAREAVRRYYQKNHGIRLDKNQIFLTANTSEAYSFIFKLLADPGQNFLTPRPSYPLLDYLTSLHDLISEKYPLTYQKRWNIDFEKMPFNQNTRGLLLVNPNNPTGSFISEEERKKIITISRKTAVPIIADEVFLDYFLSGESKPESFAGCSETLTFTLSGISKILGLPQMKLGWIVVSGPEELKNASIEKLEIISDTYLSAGTPAQNALSAWMEQTDNIQNEIRARVSKNARFAAQIPAHSGIKILMPEGGWNMILKMPDSQSDEEWAITLLEENLVLTHPGYLFDFEEGSFLVISLLTPEDVFKTGIARILEGV